MSKYHYMQQDEALRYCNRLVRRNLDGPEAPYPGMATAFEAHTGQSWTDPDWRAETSIWAAAWKAALLHNAEVTGAEAALSPVRWNDLLCRI